MNEGRQQLPINALQNSVHELLENFHICSSLENHMVIYLVLQTQDINFHRIDKHQITEHCGFHQNPAGN